MRSLAAASALLIVLAACQDQAPEDEGADPADQSGSVETGGPSLPPGPSVAEDAQVAAGELVVLVDDPEPLESAVRDLGGQLASYDDRIGIAIVEFDQVSHEELLERRDQLRAWGFDASVNAEVEDPTS